MVRVERNARSAVKWPRQKNEYLPPRALLCAPRIDTTQTQPEGENRYAQDNSMYPVLETLAEGSVVEMKVVMSTYHWVRFCCPLRPLCRKNELR